ncbi:MAG: hypothetical protein ABIG44_03930, partial [Planctomycetota bacterium]
PPASDALDYAHDGVAIGPNAGYGAYFRALGQSLAFPTDPGNLVTFLILVAFLGVGQALSFAMIICCIGVLALLIINCWYISYQLNVVLGAAAGDKELPSLALTGGILDDIVTPLVKMLATYIVARLPALIFIATATDLGFTGGMGLSDVATFLFGNYSLLWGLTQISEQIIAGALLVGGFFMWPIFVLVVAGGSTGSLLRIDLMAITIIKSFPAYLMMVAVVYAAQAVEFGTTIVLIKMGLNAWEAGTSPWALLLLPVVFMLVSVYATIVAMKAIGLHYHCFKHKYAWSWG